MYATIAANNTNYRKMEILEKLFGGSGRVKVMRLFLFNPGKIFSREDVSLRAQIEMKAAAKELNHLEKTGLVKRKLFMKDAPAKKEDRKASDKKKIAGWHLDPAFPYLIPLENLLIDLGTMNHEELVEQIKSAGKVKLVIVAGIFIQDAESRVDLLVVGDGLKKNTLETIVKRVEAEIGKEVRYASFETPDFRYRLNVYDKLIRDILDYPHKVILDKIGV